MDEEDYELFAEWLFDEDIYVPSFDEWLVSDEVEDLNEDGELDEADYELFVELYFDEDDPYVPSFDEWLSSAMKLRI